MDTNNVWELIISTDSIDNAGYQTYRCVKELKLDIGSIIKIETYTIDFGHEVNFYFIGNHQRLITYEKS